MNCIFAFLFALCLVLNAVVRSEETTPNNDDIIAEDENKFTVLLQENEDISLNEEEDSEEDYREPGKGQSINCRSSGKRRCRSECYDPSREVCCDRSIVRDKNEWGRCKGLKKGQCYKRSTHRCCQGRVLQKGVFRTCGNKCYDLLGPYTCCNKRIISKLKFALCIANGKDSCYNKDTHVCCVGEVRRITKHVRKCGLNSCFDSRRQICCSGVAQPKDALQSMCNGVCYVPQQQKCCDGQVVENRNAGICGAQCFDKTKHICCPPNRLFDLKNHFFLRHCGPHCIDSRNTFCCKGQQPFVKGEKTADCNGNCYIPNRQKCCNGQVIDTKNFALCGKEKLCYDKTKHICCPNGPTLFDLKNHFFLRRCGPHCIDSRNTNCCKGEQPYIDGEKTAECSNGKCFITRRQKCCNGDVIDTKNYAQCGNTCYDKSKHICCKTTLFLRKTHPFFIRCGRSCVSNKSKKCCNGRVVSLHEKTATCNGRCYVQKDSICCNGGIIRRNDYRLCNQKCFDKSTHVCCKGVIKVPSKYEQNCDGQCFDPRKWLCCRYCGHDLIKPIRLYASCRGHCYKKSLFTCKSQTKG